jgi:hypothetical protein
VAEREAGICTRQLPADGAADIKYNVERVASVLHGEIVNVAECGADAQTLP